MSLPLVAIVGAPNVGKSTLFNRLVGGRRAIVTDQPGMTRDRLYGEVHDTAWPFRLVDTGGLTPHTEAPFAREIERQADAALNEASVILFVVDARAGASSLDRELASMLRRRGQPLLLVANKVDGESVEPRVHELYELALGEPLAVSGEHGRGIVELIEAIENFMEQTQVASSTTDESDRPMNVAIVGRPNVGKSSILNRLVGEERVLVSEIPGTTRDSIDTLLETPDQAYRLIDTAGIRRAGRVREAAERYSVHRAKQNIERADVAVLVLDASEPLAAQDTHIAGYVLEAYRPLVVAVNKWDLVVEREQAVKDWEERIRYRLRFAKEVPIVFVSAVSGQRVSKILDMAAAIYELAGTRIPTTELNRWLLNHRAADRDAPPPKGSLRLFYATQTGVHPPRFVLFCNDPKNAHFSVRRQLSNSLRTHFALGASPIRLVFRGRREPVHR